MLDLSINPVSVRFKMSEELKLREALEELDRHSVMHDILSVQDLQLDAEGQVVIGAERYRYTHLALSQLCNFVCSSMFGFVRELSGVQRSIKESRGDYSFDEAVKILNSMVRRRFDTRLGGKKLLRNAHTKTIDGILGANYRWLPNVKMFDLASAAMTAHDLKPTFYEATLNGRWLLMRYCCKKPYFAVPGPAEPDRFHYGFHFSNDEVGQAAAKAATLLMRQMGRTCALSEIKVKGRVHHRGNAFEARMQQLLAQALEGPVPTPEYFVERLTKMRSAKLPGVGTSQSVTSEKALSKLAAKLHQRELPRDLCRRFIDSAIAQGSYNSLKNEVATIQHEDRTVYDLFTAIGREAKTLSIRHREASEQIAYMLLTGSVSVT